MLQTAYDKSTTHAQIQTHATQFENGNACIVMSVTIVLQHNRRFYVVLQCRVLSITE